MCRVRRFQCTRDCSCSTHGTLHTNLCADDAVDPPTPLHQRDISKVREFQQFKCKVLLGVREPYSTSPAQGCGRQQEGVTFVDGNCAHTVLQHWRRCARQSAPSWLASSSPPVSARSANLRCICQRPFLRKGFRGGLVIQKNRGRNCSCLQPAMPQGCENQFRFCENDFLRIQRSGTLFQHCEFVGIVPLDVASVVGVGRYGWTV